jgi:dsRNA-specific ribonuclease
MSIYLAPRDNTFKHFLRNILVTGNIKDRYIDILLNDKNIIQYSNAFTSSSVDKKNNYEIYEQLGDLSANKFIVTYMYKRFPQLYCTEGVKVTARLRINYGSQHTFSRIAEDLNFWNFITMTHEERNNIHESRTTDDQKKRKVATKKSLLEDCFEAFIGVTEKLMDDEFQIGVGYSIVYDILKHIFDKIDISLKYTDLFDAKTRLKEVFDVTPSLTDLSYASVNSKIGQSGNIQGNIQSGNIQSGNVQSGNIHGNTRNVYPGQPQYSQQYPQKINHVHYSHTSHTPHPSHTPHQSYPHPPNTPYQQQPINNTNPNIINTNTVNTDNNVSTTITCKYNGRVIQIGQGIGANKSSSECNAAEAAIEYLEKNMNIKKEIPKIYNYFCS